jgi:cellulose synthase/poly-beta-1,6-N-acetylglucosamine synthase-like glycosyltransferase
MGLTTIIFYGSLGIILYTYCGYILICVAVSKIFKIKFSQGTVLPSITAIIPCYNEEKIIEEKIKNLLQLDYPKDKLQIIIASESTDRTNQIVSKYQEAGLELYQTKKRFGKSALIFNAFHLAKGEIILFSDANAMLDSLALKKIARNFYDSKVGAVVGLLCINNSSHSHISKAEDLYKKYETILRTSNSALGHVLNSDGAIFAIRRNLYHPITPEKGDDFELIIRILISKHYSVFEPQALAFEAASVTARQETNRKIRMVSWLIKSAASLLKEMLFKWRLDLVYQLISHKFLRWLTPFFLLSLFISNALILNINGFFKIFFILQSGFYLYGLLGLILSQVLKIKIPAILGFGHYFIMYNYAFLIGVLKGMLPLGRYHAWKTDRF